MLITLCFFCSLILYFLARVGQKNDDIIITDETIIEGSTFVNGLLFEIAVVIVVIIESPEVKHIVSCGPIVKIAGCCFCIAILGGAAISIFWGSTAVLNLGALMK